MSRITDELYKLGFNCGIEKEIYIRDTGKHTSLIIEGFKQDNESYYTYDFYK